MPRNHPCTCTACGRSFDAFKQLRKHWDRDCSACPPTTPSPPSPPPRQQIDPASNLWLNDDLFPNEDRNDTNDTNNDTITISDDESHNQAGGPAGESCGQAGDTCGHSVGKQNELIMLLLGVVEQLSEIVLGDSRPTTTTAPITYSSPEMSTPCSPQIISSPSKSNNKWTMVSGKTRPAHKSKQPNFKCRNPFELLESIPTEIQQHSPDTSTVEVPINTWATSTSALQPKQQQRRPNVVVNQYPERENGWQKTVPGSSSFADIVKHGKRAVLFSDSICNRFSEWQMNNKMSSCKIKKKSFPGATALDLAEHHVHPYFKRNNADTAIIHAGANDILQLGDEEGGLTEELMNEVCTNILMSGMVCKEYGINRVCISSVLPARSKKYQLSAIFINQKLESMCREVGFDFIRNENIIYEKPTTIYEGLFYKDGLHLNDDGRELLMGNFIEYLDRNYLNTNHD